LKKVEIILYKIYNNSYGKEMKKIFYPLIFLLILVIGIVSGLQYTGFFFNESQIITPDGYIDWEQFDNETFNFNDDEYINSSNNYSIFLDITEKMKEIDGIENINYEIFMTNDSMQDIIQYYSNILELDGFSISTEYSGITPSEYYELNYYTFIKGFNGVVIFIKTYEKLTWVFYSTGNILEYQNIINNLQI